MTSPRVFVLIPAAGRGRRFGEGLPKQYRPLQARPVLSHVLARFEAHPAVERIVVAIHPDDAEDFARAATGLSKVAAPVHGGAERVDSVRAALAALPAGEGVVLVHDAVRPWISAALIDAVVEAAARHGAAIPALPVTETVKIVEGEVIIDTPPRERLYGAQTPQGFRRDLLEGALAALPEGPPPTDEARAVELAGHTVHVVPGESANVKITHLEDLPAAAETDLRVGTGYDVHAFADERPLILGGVQVEAPRGLAGHSDADVLTHAVIDALLGAAGMGDIGRLYPDTDPAFEGADSIALLRDVCARLQAAAITVVNVDSVIMAQAPKLAPHVDAMAAAMAAAIGLPADRVAVKATTTERLGFVGRQEGIAAQATVLLRRPVPAA
jgi:2-C-methyl-D-erythritol 4-phosphate cytidylyltransferase/2-C-methyl-D-erythritol 2,4-cyclodiphosphate synthase